MQISLKSLLQEAFTANRKSRTFHSLRRSRSWAPTSASTQGEKPPHNVVAARLLHTADAPPSEDRVLSNSLDPSGESLNSPIMRAKFHALLEMMKSLQQRLVHVQPGTSSITPANLDDVPSPLATITLTPDMAPNAHHHQATSQPHPLSALRASDGNNPLAFHLQMQSIPNEFWIPEMTIFGPASDLTGHSLPDHPGRARKMWFASLAPGSITSFRQLTDPFEAWFSNQRQRLITATLLICIR
ncbi:hypothetical protein ACLOJK_007318 [Asimina triloba]